MKAVLLLNDGTVIEGSGFGDEAEVYGEVVFSTSMTGYQEALTDPSYSGQILTLTYPLIGNYGINTEYFESERINVEGFVIKENCQEPYHRSSFENIDDFLREQKIPGIAGVDTRALTIKLREYGVIQGALKTSKEDIDVHRLMEKSLAQKPYGEKDLVRKVTTKKILQYGSGEERIAVIDCGMKWSIRKNLLKRGFSVSVVPAFLKVKEILDMEPQGIVISPGPGDPVQAPYVTETIRELMNHEIPTFGICLGHQMLALASGAYTFKLKFGHRGANQPVKDLSTGRVYITSQNHGFGVSIESLEGTEFNQTLVNLNDGTCEGLKHRSLPIMTTQFHPEASPGPKDTEYMFDVFAEMVHNYAKKRRY
ncbi:carbamoyl-phosphate synthase small chain [archaeon]|nr:carbamoyl-phosphate synthase small chain [archaeon]